MKDTLFWTVKELFWKVRKKIFFSQIYLVRFSIFQKHLAVSLCKVTLFFSPFGNETKTSQQMKSIKWCKCRRGPMQRIQNRKYNMMEDDGDEEQATGTTLQIQLESNTNPISTWVKIEHKCSNGHVGHCCRVDSSKSTSLQVGYCTVSQLASYVSF